MAEIQQTWPDADVRLIKSSGGAYEVAVDGVTVFSKKALGRHAQPGEVVESIRKHRAG